MFILIQSEEFPVFGRHFRVQTLEIKNRNCCGRRYAGGREGERERERRIAREREREGERERERGRGSNDKTNEETLRSIGRSSNNGAKQMSRRTYFIRVMNIKPHNGIIKECVA
jgi:hypothetical protein